MSFFREDDDKKEVTQIQFSNYDEKADGAAAVRNLNRFRPRAKKRRIVNKKWKKVPRLFFIIILHSKQRSCVLSGYV